MTKRLLKFFQAHLDTPGVVVKTGQFVPPISERNFGRASDITGVVHSKAETVPTVSSHPA